MKGEAVGSSRTREKRGDWEWARNDLPDGRQEQNREAQENGIKKTSERMIVRRYDDQEAGRGFLS